MKNVTVLKAKTNKQSTFYLVYNSVGVIIGFLEKFRNDRSTTNPWKAFGMQVVDGQPQVDPEKFATFYAEDGGKEAAIKQVVAFYQSMYWKRSV